MKKRSILKLPFIIIGSVFFTVLWFILFSLAIMFDMLTEFETLGAQSENQINEESLIQ